LPYANIRKMGARQCLKANANVIISDTMLPLTLTLSPEVRGDGEHGNFVEINTLGLILSKEGLCRRKES
jgi:hypothetical protein